MTEKREDKDSSINVDELLKVHDRIDRIESDRKLFNLFLLGILVGLFVSIMKRETK